MLTSPLANNILISYTELYCDHVLLYSYIVTDYTEVILFNNMLKTSYFTRGM